MKKYYKLVRQADLLPSLRSKLLDEAKWQAQVKAKLPRKNYYVTEGHGEQNKRVPLAELPAAFILEGERDPLGLGSILTLAVPFIGPTLFAVTELTKAMAKGPREAGSQPILICNLSQIAPDMRENLLRSIDALEKPKDVQDVEQLLEDFYEEKGSLLHVAPRYISKNFPLTYGEEMIYDSIFTQHPLVGYEHMLVPLERYYKFLSEQSFNEFLTILVRLGVKRVELMHSENKLMKNALSAYIGHQRLAGLSGEYTRITSESGHSYWGMEFEGRQITPEQLSGDFLQHFPFHRNNGTLGAMIEGIRSGNRNRTYTVERNFTGTYGLDIGAAIKILGFEAGFDFQKEIYSDEKSTFNVLY